MTRAETLHLATPQELRDALAVIGIDWAIRDGAAPMRGDLLCWVLGGATADSAGDASSPRDRGILYLGVESGGAGRTGHSVHAGTRRGGGPVIGASAASVTGQIRAADDLESVLHAAGARLAFAVDPDRHGPLAERLERIRLSAQQGTLLTSAERIAVRFCMHLGTIGAAVNSQFASAWEIKGNLRPYDELAYWLACEARERVAA